MRKISGVQLKDIKRLMFMLGLKETMDQLAMAKQCSLAWQCAEERGRSCLKKGIRF